jgi:serine/threonine protein kinase
VGALTRWGGTCTAASAGPESEGQPLDFLRGEWVIPLQDITLGAEIGRGFFGVVHRGVWHGQTVAIKKIYRTLPRGELEMFAREIRIVSSLRSPDIVLFMGVCTTSSDILLVTEFLDRGSLHDALLSRDAELLTPPRRCQLMRDIACGMAYLHGRCVGHPRVCGH